nr:NADH dehydrogenase subunit 6 [Peloridora minuta]
MTKLMLITLNTTLSTTFLFITHPLMMGLVLMIQTTLTCLMVNFIQWTNWVTFIIFVLIMGGMLILFIYVISLASNEMIKTPTIPWKKLFIWVSIMILTSPNAWFMGKMSESLDNLARIQLPITEINLLVKLFNYNMASMIIMLMLLLFFNLCVMVALINIHEGPLRTKS